jgi:MFS family permease
MLIAIPIAAIHTAYYLNIGPFLSGDVGIPLRFVGPTLALSQLSEIVFLFILGPLLLRFGYRTILTAGAAAQAMRFAVFAINPGASLVIASLTLQGIAYACFFTTAILYIDQVFPPEVRHSAQTVFGIVLFGLGPGLAGPYSQLFDRFAKHTTAGAVPDFRAIWWIQSGIATASAIAVLIFFSPKTTPARQVVTATTVPQPLEL